MTEDQEYDGIAEAAEEIVFAFSFKHPEVMISYLGWSELKEMIEREFRGRWLNEKDDGETMRAYDLLDRK